MEYYVRSFTLEADLREKDVVLGMNSYNVIRRGNSGCLPAFDLFGIEMPDDVFDNSIFRTMYEDASDLVTISNVSDLRALFILITVPKSKTQDIYSYDKEQSTGHEAINILTVLQREQGITLQQAVDCAAERFKFLVERFETNMQRLPSFSGEINTAVRWVAIRIRSFLLNSRQSIYHGVEVVGGWQYGVELRVLSLLWRARPDRKTSTCCRAFSVPAPRYLCPLMLFCVHI